jgi:hypothetical protein
LIDRLDAANLSFTSLDMRPCILTDFESREIQSIREAPEEKPFEPIDEFGGT